MTLTIYIRDFFYTAGKIYQWEGNSLGVGLNKEEVIKALVNCEPIKIIVKGKYTKITTGERVIATGEKYNSYYNANGTELIVIPWEDRL